MKVKELIEKLQKTDQEADVYCKGLYYEDWGYEWEEVTEVVAPEWMLKENKVRIQ